MKQFLTLIARWLAWMLLITFEAVVGFPWLSLYLAQEWIFSLGGEAVFASIFFLAVVFSAVYGLSLTLSTTLMLALWQTRLRTRKNSAVRWLVLLVSTLVVGFLTHIQLTVGAVGMTLISAVFFFKVSGGALFRQSWQKTHWGRFLAK